MPAPRLSRELTVRRSPLAAWGAKARRARRAFSGTTEERTIFWPGRAMALRARRVREGVGTRETRRRARGVEAANFVKELLMSMRRRGGEGD